MQTNTYWNHRGRYEATAETLGKLIPQSGECADHKTKNRALDKFRRARNCYYDLFNNGLCNRASEFRQIFGFSPKKMFPSKTWPRSCGIDLHSNALVSKLDAVMDEIIIAAANEQGVEMEQRHEEVRRLRNAIEEAICNYERMMSLLEVHANMSHKGGRFETGLNNLRAALQQPQPAAGTEAE